MFLVFGQVVGRQAKASPTATGCPKTRNISSSLCVGSPTRPWRPDTNSLDLKVEERTLKTHTLSFFSFHPYLPTTNDSGKICYVVGRGRKGRMERKDTSRTK